MGNFMGRGNKYIQFVKVVYCKLPTIGKNLEATNFPTYGLRFELQTSKKRGECVTTVPLRPLPCSWSYSLLETRHGLL